ncbi:AAA family ATPase, partial [Listeria monocytogenes]|nr:AAA family ATPase [Listeria monocytogenes]
EKVFDTGERYSVLYKGSKTEYPYNKEDILIKSKVELTSEIRKTMDYFTNIAKHKDVESDLGQNKGKKFYFYKKQMEKLEGMNRGSALYSYLNKTNEQREEVKQLIFPFGLNYSQMQAVKNSFSHQISVIQGPPGTGKTQTILNIIANAVKNQKNIAVVSPNNKATTNVYEKLEKEGFKFIAAQLGNSTNRNNFYNNISKVPKEIKSWFIQEEQLLKLEQDLDQKQKKIVELLKEKNKIATLKQKLREWELEQKYFKDYQNDFSLVDNSKVKIKKMSSIDFNLVKKQKFIIDLMTYNPGIPHLFYRFKYFFKYGIYHMNGIKSELGRMEAINKNRKEYYSDKIEAIKNEIIRSESFLAKNQYESTIKDIELCSKQIFKHNLCIRYQAKNEREFSTDSHKNEFEKFSASFPVILSTCDSIMECISNEQIFDYVVVDESSMASLVPGIFSLAKAKNIIIVGDDKQLPSIQIDKKKINELSTIPSEYDYFENNLLTSLIGVYGEKLPSTMLKEHYRCHPMIINFCNKQYYNDELVIMTENKGIKNPLVRIKTSEGNHMKFDQDAKIFNQREIDTFLSTEFTEKVPEIKGIESLGFVDSSCLLNVAVSRAKKILVLNTSEEVFMNNDKDIAALIRYIKYYGEHSIVYQSKVHSIFDLLQQEFSAELEKKLSKIKKKHSKYNSENLTRLLIDEILKEPEFKHLSYQPEYEIRLLAKDLSILSDEQIKYVTNGASLDFIFFNKMDKEPIAAIEVDGHKFHKYDRQKLKDSCKKDIINTLGIKFETLSTNGSGEEDKIRAFLKSTLIQNAEGEK